MPTRLATSPPTWGRHQRGRGRGIQPDGNIVAAGNVGGSGNAFVLARYLPDGRLDRRFGDRGTVTIDVNGGGNALVIQADGKLVAAGSGRGRRGFFALARYLAS